MVKSFKDLIVWQKSIELCTLVYQVTKKYPRDELYGIVSQIRRSCVAIPSNIAEGQTRGHKQEYVQFLRIAFASAAELETQLLVSEKINYISDSDFEKVNNLLQEILKMLNKLISVLLEPSH